MLISAIQRSASSNSWNISVRISPLVVSSSARKASKPASFKRRLDQLRIDRIEVIDRAIAAFLLSKRHDHKCMRTHLRADRTRHRLCFEFLLCRHQASLPRVSLSDFLLDELRSWRFPLLFPHRSSLDCSRIPCFFGGLVGVVGCITCTSFFFLKRLCRLMDASINLSHHLSLDSGQEWRSILPWLYLCQYRRGQIPERSRAGRM